MVVVLLVQLQHYWYYRHYDKNNKHYFFVTIAISAAALLAPLAPPVLLPVLCNWRPKKFDSIKTMTFVIVNQHPIWGSTSSSTDWARQAAAT